MRVQSLLLYVFLAPTGVAAQVTSASELDNVARQIIADVKEEHECEFVVLWTQLDGVTGKGIARVFLSGEQCESAMADANSRGDVRGITFAKLQSRDERIRSEQLPRLSQPIQPRPPPEDFTLLHDVVE